MSRIVILYNKLHSWIVDSSFSVTIFHLFNLVATAGYTRNTTLKVHIGQLFLHLGKTVTTLWITEQICNVGCDLEVCNQNKSDSVSWWKKE